MPKKFFQLLAIISISLFFFLSCAKEYKETMKFSSRMKDGGRCVFEIEIITKSQASIDSIKAKKQRINLALNLILFEYRTGQLKSKGKSSVRKIFLRVVKNTTNVSDIDIAFKSFVIASP